MSIYNGAGQRSGVQGLLHKSEMSWDVVMTVDDIVQMGTSARPLVLLQLLGISHAAQRMKFLYQLHHLANMVAGGNGNHPYTMLAIQYG